MRIILNLLVGLINIAELLILIECLLSWVVQDPGNEIMRCLKVITRPILEPFRRAQDKYFKDDLSVDISPVMAIVALFIVKKVIFIIF